MCPVFLLLKMIKNINRAADTGCPGKIYSLALFEGVAGNPVMFEDNNRVMVVGPHPWKEFGLQHIGVVHDVHVHGVVFHGLLYMAFLMPLGLKDHFLPPPGFQSTLSQ